MTVMERWLRRVDLFEPSEKKFTRPEMMLFHALLYDDGRDLVASVFETERSELGIRKLPAHLVAAARRMKDLITRYET